MKNPSEFSEQLKREPAINSPDSLDQEILAYSRDHAPQSQVLRTPRWMSAVATCSVIALSVLLVMRSNQESTLSTPQLDIATEESATSVSPATAGSDVITTSSRDEDLNADYPARTRSKSDDSILRNDILRNDVLQNDEPELMQIEVKTARQKKEAIRVSPEQLAGTVSSPAGFSVTAAREERTNQPSEASTEKTESLEYVDSAAADIVANAKLKELAEKDTEVSSKLARSDTLSPEVVSELRNLKRLRENDQQEEAKKAYQLLLKTCERCNLPATLDLAIEQFSEQIEE